MLTFLRKKMRTIMILVAVVFAASMFYGIGASSWQSRGKPAPESGIAKVNGKSIDPYRYQEMMNRLVKQVGTNLQPSDLAFVQNLALGQTVDFTLILAKAKGEVKVINREVDAAINNIVKQEKLASTKDLENSLKRLGLNLGRFKQMVKDEMLVQKMIGKVRGGVVVTPDDLREVRARHILVSQEAIAQDLLARIKKGEDFAALAKKYSLDPGSAAKGGDLDYFTTGTMVGPFEKAAFSMKIGEVSDQIKTSFGYHIIKVTDSRLRKFAGEEKDIDKAALAEKQEKVFRKWFGELKSGAKIEIINPTLLAHDLRFKGRILEAIAAYKKAVALDPANPFLHIFLGDTYNTIGKTDLALSEYEVAISLEGGNPLFYIILARAYEKTGQKAMAVKQYKRASLVAGDNKNMHEELLKKFKELKAMPEYRREQEEIARIEKKEKFEKELRGDQ
ncbi:MAG: peptidylprolyl isomerase [Candidatus Margulisbacteria bacterium]|nr:peptidylprolyl isomerase [Candidatus Margulisiibacteriota bacterium]